MKRSPAPFVTLIERGDLSGALPLLRDLWAETRDGSLADLVCRVGFLADERAPGSESEVLGELARQPIKTLIETLESFRDRPPDPRICFALVQVLNSSIGSQPRLWKLVYELLVVHADPRHREWLDTHVATISPDAPRFDRDGGERPAARRFHPAFVKACLDRRPLDQHESECVERASIQVGRLAATRMASLKRKLEEERHILGSLPEGTAPGALAVVADSLEEKGEARGAFLSLSLRWLERKASKAAIERFVTEHGAALKGSLGWLGPGAVVFVDGLPARVRASEALEPLALEWVVHDPRWLTIRELTFLPAGLLEQECEVLAKAPLAALERLSGRATHLEAVLRRRFKWRIGALELNDLDEVDWRAVPKQTLPRLSTVAVPRIRHDSAFWRSRLAKQVRELATEHIDDLGAFLAGAPASLRVLDLSSRAGLTAARANDGWHLRLGRSTELVVWAEAIQLLESAVDGVESVHIERWPGDARYEAALRRILKPGRWTVES